MMTMMNQQAGLREAAGVQELPLQDANAAPAPVLAPGKPVQPRKRAERSKPINHKEQGKADLSLFLLKI
jgi:hypothetical protein